MRHLLLLPALVALGSFAARAQSSPEFQDLFNGKDLTGWVNVNTAPDTWKARDGLLVCSGHPIGVMRSVKEYENFMLHIEWRHMEAGGNSGVFVWSDAVPDAESRLPNGVEVQMLELEWPNLNKQGRRHAADRVRARRAVRRRRRDDGARQPARRAEQVGREPLQGQGRVEHLRRRRGRRRHQALGQRQVRQRHRAFLAAEGVPVPRVGRRGDPLPQHQDPGAAAGRLLEIRRSWRSGECAFSREGGGVFTVTGRIHVHREVRRLGGILFRRDHTTSDPVKVVARNRDAAHQATPKKKSDLLNLP